MKWTHDDPIDISWMTCDPVQHGNKIKIINVRSGTECHRPRTATYFRGGKRIVVTITEIERLDGDYQYKEMENALPCRSVDSQEVVC